MAKFCYSSWISAQLSTNGNICFCPTARNSEVGLDASALSSIVGCSEILNSEKAKRIRKILMSGDFPLECSSCKEVEETGGKSFRMALDEGLSKYIDKESLLASTDIDGGLESPHIQYLELRLGRFCNLRCRFCSPVDSSGWDTDYFRLYDKTFESNSQSSGGSDQDWHQSEGFLNWLRGISDHLITIQFAGGEPLLSKSHRTVLDLLILNGSAERINLVYVTNGTVLPDYIFKYWKKFKSVQVFVSLEGIERNYEYQRWPAKWSTLLANINRLKNEIGKSILRLTIQPHVNIYNVATIFDLAIWCLEQGDQICWNKQLNFLTEPTWQSPFILNHSEKTIICKKIEAGIERIVDNFSDSKKRDDIILWLKSVAAILPNKDWSHLRGEANQLSGRLDQIRNGYAKDYLDIFTTSLICDQS